MGDRGGFLPLNPVPLRAPSPRARRRDVRTELGSSASLLEPGRGRHGDGNAAERHRNFFFFFVAKKKDWRSADTQEQPSATLRNNELSQKRRRGIDDYE